MENLGRVQSQITFLYYRDLQPAVSFYSEVMGFELVEDQAWAKIYRMAGDAFLGIVAGEKGFHQPQAQNAVLVTFVVDDLLAWYEHLESRGVKMLSEVQHRAEIQIRRFFFEDPGGYTLEIQQFLKPDRAEVFGGA